MVRGVAWLVLLVVGLVVVMGLMVCKARFRVSYVLSRTVVDWGTAQWWGVLFVVVGGVVLFVGLVFGVVRFEHNQDHVVNVRIVVV